MLPSDLIKLKKNFKKIIVLTAWDSISGSLIEENSKLRFLKAGVFNKKWLLNGRDKGRWAGYPTPNVIYGKFDPNGYSDHLPVFLYLAKEID